MKLLLTLTFAILLMTIVGCFGKPPESDASEKTTAGTRETFPLPERLPPRSTPQQIPEDTSASAIPTATPTPEALAEVETDDEIVGDEEVEDAPDPGAKALNRQKRKQERQQLRQSQAEEIAKDLNFSPDQSRQFQEAVRERREQTRDIREQILNTLTEEQKKQFKEMQRNGRVDYQALGLTSSQSATVDKLREELKRRQQLSKQRLEHMLTPEQMEKYKERRKRQKKQNG